VQGYAVRGVDGGVALLLFACALGALMLIASLH
jgi:hypothetical protein